MTSKLPYLAISSTMALVLSACSDSSALSDELTRPRGGYVPEPEGCLPYISDEFPLLPMPYYRVIETYVPPGSDLPHFALDYEVWPLAQVEALRLENRSDPLVQVPDVELPGRCQRTLDSDQLGATSMSQEVVALRVYAGDATLERSAAVFFAVGDRTLTVTAPSQLNPEEWFLVFEPSWGGPRVALAPLVGPGPSWTFSGLPAGPARVALVQTAFVRTQSGFATLHAAEGFASAWPEYITGWYGANVTSSQEEVQLRQLLPSGTAPEFSNFATRPRTVLSGTSDHLIIDAIPGTRGELEVPCGVGVQLALSGAGTVALTHGDEERVLDSDQAVTQNDDCTSGSWTMELVPHPTIGRSLDLVVSEAP